MGELVPVQTDNTAELLIAVEQQNEMLSDMSQKLDTLNEGMTFFCAVFMIYIVSKAVWTFLNRVVFAGL